MYTSVLCCTYIQVDRYPYATLVLHPVGLGNAGLHFGLMETFLSGQRNPACPDKQCSPDKGSMPCYSILPGFVCPQEMQRCKPVPAQIVWAAHADSVCREHCQGGVIIIVWQDYVSFPHSRRILCAVATPTEEVSQEHMPGESVLIAEPLHSIAA